MLAMCRPIVLMLIICGGTLMSAAQQAKTLLTLQNQATAGDPAAQESLCGSYYMGDNDSTGAGIPKDDKRALFWCRKAGAQGRVQAQFVASSILSFGGVPHDEVESTMWLRKAAEQDATYSALLALRYRDGQGVPKDTAQAIFWFRKAAAQGDSSSKDELAKLEHPEDRAKSVLLALQQQAGSGDASAQLRLGEIYENSVGIVSGIYHDGTTVPEDDGQALVWFRKAGQQGLAAAQFAAGGLLLNGKGIPHDFVESAMWLRKAAEQGFIPAQASLAALYQYGVGVPKDLSLAIFWYRQAANNGNQDAKNELAKLDAAPPAPVATQVAQEQDNLPVDTSADDEAEAKKAEIEEKINDLESDIEELQHEVETWQNSAEQLSDCSGVGAAICEAGAAKAQSNANKANNQIDEKRRQIARLQGEEAQETARRSTNTAEIYAQRQTSQAGNNNSPSPVQARQTVNSTISQGSPSSDGCPYVTSSVVLTPRFSRGPASSWCTNGGSMDVGWTVSNSSGSGVTCAIKFGQDSKVNYQSYDVGGQLENACAFDNKVKYVCWRTDDNASCSGRAIDWTR